MVAATVRFDAPKSGKKSARKAKGESGRQDACPTNRKQPWMPSDLERLIFRWVKFDGERQSWVAQQFGLNQSTVSRIVKRYERWIARGGDEQEGAPSHDERQRAQKWLTYERNEWIICSALRLAAEMERHYESSKTTMAGESAYPGSQREVRTERKEIDRTGVACRYLRLAYRVNMDQMRLVQEGPLQALEPLAVDASAEADWAEIKASDEKSQREVEESARRAIEAQERSRQAQRAVEELHRQEAEDRGQESEAGEPVAGDHSLHATDHSPLQMTNDQGSMTTEGVHKMHNDAGAETGLSHDGATECGENGRPKKSAAYAYPANGEAPVADTPGADGDKNRPADGRRLTWGAPILTG